MSSVLAITGVPAGAVSLRIIAAAVLALLSCLGDSSDPWVERPRFLLDSDIRFVLCEPRQLYGLQ